MASLIPPCPVRNPPGGQGCSRAGVHPGSRLGLAPRTMAPKRFDRLPIKPCGSSISGADPRGRRGGFRPRCGQSRMGEAGACAPAGCARQDGHVTNPPKAASRFGAQAKLGSHAPQNPGNTRRSRQRTRESLRDWPATMTKDVGNAEPLRGEEGKGEGAVSSALRLMGRRPPRLPLTPRHHPSCRIFSSRIWP